MLRRRYYFLLLKRTVRNIRPLKLKSKTSRLALAGILCAVSVVLLFFGSLFEVFDYALAGFCGAIVVFSIIELGTRLSVAIYFAISALSVLLLPNKLPGVLFALFLGWYPFLKRAVERYNKFICWAIKVIAFNVMAAIIIVISEKLLGAPDEMLAFKVAFFVMANVAFVLYDVVLTRFITLYLIKVKKIFK